MKPSAIVYTSNTGFTARYAAMLGERAALPVYSLSEAASTLPKGSPVLYLGWLMASTIRGYKKAAKRYTICCVCGVGLCDTGSLLPEIRRAEKIPAATPLFTLQGGIDHEKLTGIYKRMIDTLILFMRKKKNKTEGESRMLTLLENTGDYVSEENLDDVCRWYDSADDLA